MKSGDTPPKPPASLEALRDELAEMNTPVSACSKHGDRESFKNKFKDGFDAALAELARMASESFDEKAAYIYLAEQYEYKLGMPIVSDFFSGILAGALWQHARDFARIQQAEKSEADMRRDFDDASAHKVIELEAEVNELRKLVADTLENNKTQYFRIQELEAEVARLQVQLKDHLPFDAYYLEWQVERGLTYEELDQLKAEVERLKQYTIAGQEVMLKELQTENARLKAALERIVALTHSWVIAEETVNCRHTYDQIRKEAREALEGSKP